jgi:hypothetical protein
VTRTTVVTDPKLAGDLYRAVHGEDRQRLFHEVLGDGWQACGDVPARINLAVETVLIVMPLSDDDLGE